MVSARECDGTVFSSPGGQKVTVVIWGGLIKLIGEDADIQSKIRKVFDAAVYVAACKACTGRELHKIEKGVELPSNIGGRHERKLCKKRTNLKDIESVF